MLYVTEVVAEQIILLDTKNIEGGTDNTLKYELTLEKIKSPFDNLNLKKQAYFCRTFCIVFNFFTKQYRKYDKTFTYSQVVRHAKNKI